MVFQFIGAAIGIAGAISNISAASSSARRQNAAIASQQLASAQAEAERIEAARVQREFAMVNYNTERLMRRIQYQRQITELQMAAAQNRMQNTMAVSRVTTEDSNLQQQAYTAENEAASRRRQRENAGAEASVTARQRVASTLSQAQIDTNQFRDADRQVTAMTERPSGNTRSSSSDRALRGSLRADIIAQGMQALNQNQSLATSTQQEIQNATFFDQLIRGRAI